MSTFTALVPQTVDTLPGLPLERYLTKTRVPKPRRMHRPRHRVNFSLAFPLSPTDQADQDQTARRLAHEIWIKTFKVGELDGKPARRSKHAAAAFPLFVALPAELQDEIWRFSLEPKIFRTTFIHEDMLCGRDRSGRYPEGFVIKYGRARMRNIPLFWVCRQSRQLAIQLYGDPQRGEMLFNPEIDTLRLDGCGPGRHLTWKLVEPFTIDEAIPSQGGMMHYYLHMEPVPLPGNNNQAISFFRTSDCPQDEPLHDATCHFRSRDPETRYYFGYSPSLLAKFRNVEIYVSLFEIILVNACNGGGPNILERFRRWTAPLPNLRRVALMFYADASNLEYVRLAEMASVEIKAAEREVAPRPFGPFGPENPTQSWVSFVAALVGERGFWPGLRCLDFVMENLDFSNKLRVGRAVSDAN